MLRGKKITVGITGGIAAYKAADIVSWLKQEGALVRVAMTTGATKIIAPLTLKTLSGQKVALDIFDEGGDLVVPHIELADCDAVIVIPATANILAKAAYGLADDLLSATLLATVAPVMVFPAMNIHMYANPATQANLEILRGRGYQVVEPAEGRMACGTSGKGRLPAIDDLKQAIKQFLVPKAGLLAGKNVLVTAGPTYEYIDPVRFIGNRSSGKMGYAVALAAEAAGAKVTLVSGPTTLADPKGMQIEKVISAAEMAAAVKRHYAAADIVVMAAAVADYKPETQAAQKLKKGTATEQTLTLTANPDILLSLGQQKGEKILVGFAAESENLLANAQQKLVAKNLDLIVANNICAAGAGFDGDTNIITLISRQTGENQLTELPLLSKDQAAAEIIAAIGRLI